jgi:hypothetical protein
MSTIFTGKFVKRREVISPRDYYPVMYCFGKKKGVDFLKDDIHKIIKSPNCNNS